MLPEGPPQQRAQPVGLRGQGGGVGGRHAVVGLESNRRVHCISAVGEGEGGREGYAKRGTVRGVGWGGATREAGFNRAMCWAVPYPEREREGEGGREGNGSNVQTSAYKTSV